MNKPQISILVPVYNTQRYLRTCLNSLVNQTIDDIEIICINDGSTDASLDIINEFSEHDPRIVVINKPNTGYGDSMNRGLEIVKGKYVGIVESDDFISEDAFEFLTWDAMQNGNPDVIRTNYFEFSENQFGEINETFIDNLAGLPQHQVICPIEHPQIFLMAPAIWSTIYNTKFLKQNNIKFLTTPGASYQDTSFVFKALYAANTALLMPDARLRYRIDNENSSVKSISKVDCVCKEYAEIWTYAKEYPERYSKIREVIVREQWGAYIWNLRRLDASLKKEFCSIFHADFKEIEHNGNLSPAYFPEKDWIDLKLLLEDSDAFCNKFCGPSEPDNALIINALDMSAERSSCICNKISEVITFKTRAFLLNENSSEVIDVIREHQKPESKCFFSEEQLFKDEISLKFNEAFLDVENFYVLDANNLKFSEFQTMQNENDLINKFTKKMNKQDLLAATKPCVVNKAPKEMSLLACELQNKVSLKPACSENEGANKTFNYCREVMNGANEFVNNETNTEFKLQHKNMLTPCWNRAKRALQSLPTSYYDSIKQTEKKMEKIHAICVTGNEVKPELNPQISVIIPIYNASSYLATCLESVLAQQDVNIEVIAIDDGSSDSSLSILLDYAEKDDRIRTYTQFNHGVAITRNRGIELAKGEYLSFIDPDDCYASQHSLSDLYSAAKTNNVLICGGSMGIFSRDERHISETFPLKQSHYRCDEERYVPYAELPNEQGWIRFIYSKELFVNKKVRFPNLTYYEDPVFFMRIVNEANGYYEIPNNVYRYRWNHKPSHTESINSLRLMDLLEGVSENLERAKQSNNKRLYSAITCWLEREFSDQIANHLNDLGVLTKLLRIQTQFDSSLYCVAEEQNMNYWILKPLKQFVAKMEETKTLRDDLSSEKAKKMSFADCDGNRETAIERGAARLANSWIYNFAQRMIWKIKDHHHKSFV